MSNGAELIDYQSHVRITLKHGLRSTTLTEQQGRNIKMNRLRNAPRVIAIVVTMMVLFSSLQTGVRAQSPLDPIVVLYDAGHNQQYDAFDLEEGMNLMLNDSVAPNLSLFLTNSLIPLKLIQKGSAFVHAACLDRNGEGLLIVAPPDTGKTYTTLSLNNSGFNFLSDDLTIIKGKKGNSNRT